VDEELDGGCACGGARTLGLLLTAETMTAFSGNVEQITSTCSVMVNAR
jgi:hypothetical protein